MKSICLSCLIYTLKDKDPKDNVYLNIFYNWLARVVQYGGLTSQDILEIKIDTRTFEYLIVNNSVLPIILEKLQCPYSIINFKEPSNSLEGMMNKYLITDYTQDVYIYCDIDILISNKFSTMVEKTSENTAYVCTEGLFSDDNYGQGYNNGADKTWPGFSAGKFMIYGKPLRDSFFNFINEQCDYSRISYTVEQPLFNYAIYSMPKDIYNVNFKMLTEYASFNSDEYDKNKTIFNDMAGEPGDGLVHLRKILDVSSLYIIGLY